MSWAPFSIFEMDESRHNKFGTHIDLGEYWPMNNKITSKWAWSGSYNLILKK